MTQPLPSPLKGLDVVGEARAAASITTVPRSTWVGPHSFPEDSPVAFIQADRLRLTRTVCGLRRTT